jgi:SMP-30/Gluconolactonase/LRE-like region
MARAQLMPEPDIELLAKRRVFESVGPGLRGIQRDAAGHYYILSAPAGAVLVFDSQGQRLRQVPPAAGGAPGKASVHDAIVYGDGLDVDAEGRVYVADRGANLIRVFNPDGTASLTIPVSGPTSVAAIGEGEIAVAAARSARLVTVFDRRGKIAREFGDPTDVAGRPELNRFLNIGRLATDAHGHLYYSFDYLPEPTVWKYDRNGYASLSIEVTTPEFQPVAQAARREIFRQEQSSTFVLKPVVGAFGVDPETEEVWIAIGDELLHFDREGVGRVTYRILTPEGARLEAKTILIEKDRLLIGSDPLGIYEFARPDKKPKP